MGTCRHCGQPCAGWFCSPDHQRAWYRRIMGPLAVVIALSLSAAVFADEDWQAKCTTEGGCMLITQRAFEALIGEIERLQRTIINMRAEQCA